MAPTVLIWATPTARKKDKMTWYFHKLTTFSLVYAASGDATASMIAGVASVIPDTLEMAFFGLIPHRTITHWPYIYMVLIAFFWSLFYSSGQVQFYIALFASIGCLLHVAEDALSKGGIPFCGPFGKKSGCNFYKIHSLRETLTALAIVVPCLSVAYLLGRIEESYLTAEVHRAVVIFSDLYRFVMEKVI